MKGTPIVTMEQIGEHRYLLRFYHGEFYTITWIPEEEESLKIEPDLSGMAALCHGIIWEKIKQIAIDYKEPSGEWKSPGNKTGRIN